MGGGSSSDNSSKYGGIYLQFQQQILIPGEMARGTIFLNLSLAYPGKNICIEIGGREFTRWVDRERRTRNTSRGTEYYYVDVERKAHRSIISSEIDVYSWQKGAVIPPGQYSFPFQFKVPDGLPGSFYFNRGRVIGEIKYWMQAFLRPDDKTAPRLKYDCNVIMREMPRHPIEIKEINQEKNIKTWCCINKGTVSLRTAFEKNAYAPTEEARIVTEVDNSQCTVGIKNIRLSLNQTLLLVAGGHQKYFHFVVATSSLGKVEPGQACTGDKRLEGSIHLPPGQEGEGEAYSNDTVSRITPTAHGELVKSNFYMSLVSEVDGCMCCESYPRNELPITVYSAALQRAPEPVAPPGWQPQQMPVSNIVIVIDPGMIQSPGQDPNMLMSQMPPNANQPPQLQQPQQPQSIQTQMQPQVQPQYNTVYPQPPMQPYPQQQYNMAYPQQPQQPQGNGQEVNVKQSNHIEPQTLKIVQSPK